MNSTLARNGKSTKVWESKRFIIFVSLVLVIVISLIGMASIRSSAIEYGNKLPVATPNILCAGDSFTYPVRIEISKPDTVVRITEDWHRTGTSIAPKEFVVPPIEYNVQYPVVISTNATRDVPENMPPGEWTFGHCNISTRNGELPEVSCYYVPITVKACD